MNQLPECMTRRPTDDEFHATEQRLESMGVDPWQFGTRNATMMAAALLDATEREEQLRAEVATAQSHVERLINAMRIVGAEGDGVAEDGPVGEAMDAAVSWIAMRLNWGLDGDNLAAVARYCARDQARNDEVAALRLVVAAGDFLTDAVSRGQGEQVALDCYRLARAEVTP